MTPGKTDVEPRDGQETSRLEMTNGVVTFLDILGWKGIYRRGFDPIAKLQSLLSRIREVAELSRGISPETSEPVVKSVSDTIVVFSRNIASEHYVAAIDMHGKLCANAIVHSLHGLIPVRGATSLGEFRVDENAYVGPAVDEAAAWYEQANWIGVHLTPSADYAVDGSLRKWDDYDVPMKNGPSARSRCVNWKANWSDEVGDADPSTQLKSVFRNMGPILPEFAEKFSNTLSCFESLRSHA